MKLSSRQQAVLSEIASEFNAQNSKNIDRWGSSIRHIDLLGHGWEAHGTLASLIKRGLVEVTETSVQHSTEIVSNAFGRGWHTRSTVGGYCLGRPVNSGANND